MCIRDRSVIFCTDATQLKAAKESKTIFEQTLVKNGFPKITTEIELNQPFFAAEEYHQQYLAKNPNGYCGIKGTGCALPPL